MGPSPSREHTVEIRGLLPEESRPAVNWIVLLLLDHLYRSAHLASPSSSTQQWLPTQTQTQFQFCILIFQREVPDELCVPLLHLGAAEACLRIEPRKNSKKKAIVVIVLIEVVWESSSVPS